MMPIENVPAVYVVVVELSRWDTEAEAGKAARAYNADEHVQKARVAKLFDPVKTLPDMLGKALQGATEGQP